MQHLLLVLASNLIKGSFQKFIYLFIWRVEELTRDHAKFFNFKASFSNNLLPLDSATSSVTACPIACMNSISGFSSPYLPSNIPGCDFRL